MEQTWAEMKNIVLKFHRYWSRYHQSGPFGVRFLMKKAALNPSQAMRIAMKRFSARFESARMIKYARARSQMREIRLRTLLPNSSPYNLPAVNC